MIGKLTQKNNLVLKTNCQPETLAPFRALQVAPFKRYIYPSWSGRKCWLQAPEPYL